MGLFDKIIKTNRDEKKEEEGQIIKAQNNSDKMDLVTLSEAILLDTRTDITALNTVSVPIGEMAALGGTVSSLIPAMRTVTQTTSVNASGLYRLANASVGDTLKIAKNGNFWGAFKRADGSSKFVQLAEAGPLTATSQTVMPIDPATMMMAAALYSIEQQLGKIEEMEKQII